MANFLALSEAKICLRPLYVIHEIVLDKTYIKTLLCEILGEQNRSQLLSLTEI